VVSKTLLMTSSALAFAAAFAQGAAAQDAPLATAAPMQLALAQTAAPAEPASAPAPSAPPAPAANSAVDAVVVTASRISVTGYTQPTPVTVVSAQVIQRDAKPSIGDVIRQLPANLGGASPFTQGSGVIAAGTAGLDTVNLRGLGTSRTLVLFDGQRVMQAVVTGQVDIGLLPSILVDRIDVVTAGASAAWGSDAVAGVVNLVLNKKFDGLRANFDYGNTYASDQQTYRAQIAAGRDFAGGRGHVIVAGAFTDAPDIVFAGQRSSWDHYRQLLPNPAYTATNNQPKYIHVDNVGLSQATTGGLISGGPLKGTQLVGPNATPAPFNYGITSGALTGNGSQETFNASLDNLSVAFRTLTFFGYSSYELTDDIKASVQFNWGTTHSENSSVPNTAFGNLTIPIDNAYLPASVKSLMTAAKVTSIPYGTTFLNNLQPTDRYSLKAFENTVGVPVGAIDRDLLRLVFTLDGTVKDGWYGQNWKWNVYYQLGRSHMYQTTLNNDIKANLTNAIDAVFAPAGNALNVPAGTIVCRSSLTNPTNGCVPLNIFGTGTASQAAIRYVNVKPGQNFQDQNFQQDVEAGSAQGELPFGLPAGSIGAALGIEHRSESGSTKVDPGAQAVQYALGNFSAFSGKYDVTEGFVEAEVPVLKDMVVKSLGLNLAGRVTSYSTSGTVETWKVGLTSQLDDNVRLRGTVSRDIRAPNLSELFSTGVPSTNSAVDPKTGQNVFIYTNAGGNPNLKPEIGDTYSGGIVVTPKFIPRLSLSTDYYSIDLTNAIVSVGASTVLANCNAGQTAFCGQLVFKGPGGALSQINTYPVNVASYKTSGLDFQADYAHALFSGDLALRLLGNYTLNQSQVQFGTTVNYAGAIGPDSPVAGFPRFRATVSATYSQGPASFTVQGRVIGSAQLVSTWTSKDVDNNSIPSISYLDFRGSYDVNQHFQMFATMDNALNQAPPNVAGTPGRGSGVYYSTSTRSDIYDVIGRTYRIGVRARF
jgi:outer membrane receptor protein involved in Fe transport